MRDQTDVWQYIFNRMMWNFFLFNTCVRNESEKRLQRIIRLSFYNSHEKELAHAKNYKITGMCVWMYGRWIVPNIGPIEENVDNIKIWSNKRKKTKLRIKMKMWNMGNTQESCLLQHSKIHELIFISWFFERKVKIKNHIKLYFPPSFRFRARLFQSVEVVIHCYWTFPEKAEYKLFEPEAKLCYEHKR